MSEAQRDFTTKDFKTAGGKELAIFKVANTSLYRVSFKSGGELPKELDGMWTNPSVAQRAIESYLIRKPEKKATKE